MYVNQNLFSSVLTLRTYFSVFGDIAKMWIQLSIENIQPGMRLCDELSVMSQDSREIVGKMRTLGDWSKRASANIQRIAGEVSLIGSFTSFVSAFRD